MDERYGVNVSNKFAFLSGDDESSDPGEILAKAEQTALKEKLQPKKEVKKPVTAVLPDKKMTIAPSAGAGNKENVDSRGPQRKPQQNRGDRGPRGPRRDENAPSGDAMGDRFGETRPQRPPRREGGPRNEGNNRGGFGGNRRNIRGGAADGIARPPRGPKGDAKPGDENWVTTQWGNDESGNNPQQTGGFGSNRPPRGPRAPRSDRPPRSDRISGSDKTGVRSVPKRDGYGKGNWGTAADELTGETEPQPELNKSGEGTENAAPAEDGADGAEANEAEEQKIRELTLEEWKAQHKTVEPQFNTRKAGEGGDAKIYQKLVPIPKRDPNDVDANAEEEEATHVKQRREKTLDIQVNFNDSQRNRGGYRDRDERDQRGGGRDNFRGDRRGEDRRSGGGNFRPANQGGRRGGGSGYSNQGHRQGGSGASSGFSLTAESFPALGAH